MIALQLYSLYRPKSNQNFQSSKKRQLFFKNQCLNHRTSVSKNSYHAHQSDTWMKMSNFASGDVRDNRKLHLARFWQYYFDCQPLKDYVTPLYTLHTSRDWQNSNPLFKKWRNSRLTQVTLLKVAFFLEL